MTPGPTYTPIVAAGALVWRIVDDKLKVLLIHRAHHGDVSLPKGKVDIGELLPETAVREVAEETGLAIQLGIPLGTVEYVLPGGREKVVHYWSAELTTKPKRFVPNDEVARVEWVSLAKARERLTYPHDVAVVDRFDAHWQAGTARTFAILALRHGKALAHESWEGPDSARPLQRRGELQAKAIAPSIAAYGIGRIVSSTAARCVETVRPTSRLAGVQIRREQLISQEAFEWGGSDVQGVVARRLRRAVASVLCSHGPVLPEIVREIAAQTNTPYAGPLRMAGLLSTGDFSVLHLAPGRTASGIVAVESHSPDA